MYTVHIHICLYLLLVCFKHKNSLSLEVPTPIVLELFTDSCIADTVSKHMVMYPFCFDRDLKPTNVLLDEDDRPVLMDLGSMNRARIEVRPVIVF